MIPDEPAFAALLSPALIERIDIASKAMCRAGDLYDTENDEENQCLSCDTSQGGTCVAFGLYGDLALAAIQALDIHAKDKR